MDVPLLGCALSPSLFLFQIHWESGKEANIDEMDFRVPRKPDRGNLIHVKPEAGNMFQWDLEDQDLDTDNNCLCWKEISQPSA